MASLLFNLYTADLGQALINANLYTPRLGSTKLPILQYADDLVLLDHTKIGLQKALNALHTYNLKHDLRANHSKTKVIVFGKC